MSTTPGLRERKKARTRLAISDIATRLFIERGFDSVTVAEVAEAADVSVNTIFNYFATKEELFFDRGSEVSDAPSRIVRERRPGESVIDALERVYTAAAKDDTRRSWSKTLRPFIATIDASPALRLRARVLRDQSEQRLAETLRVETGATPDDVTPRVAAALITGLEWLLVEEFSSRLLRGEADTKIRAALFRTAERGFAMLRLAIGGYGVRTV
jgi:AcrR family transcriptional regulator